MANSVKNKPCSVSEANTFKNRQHNVLSKLETLLHEDVERFTVLKAQRHVHLSLKNKEKRKQNLNVLHPV